MLEVIGIKNCNSIKKTENWLTERGLEYAFRNVKKEPLSPQELAELVKRAGLETLVNKRGKIWKSLGLADKELSDNDLFEVLLEHQNMMKRPVLVKGEAVLVGYDEDALAGFTEEEA
ncbi:arsenate reductase family protein [Balneolaceae bacterium ANBcel3]|nr:arsenate reductase family protein [Balneolaceae bacterium ANBcel3]